MWYRNDAVTKNIIIMEDINESIFTAEGPEAPNTTPKTCAELDQKELDNLATAAHFKQVAGGKSFAMDQAAILETAIETVTVAYTTIKTREGENGPTALFIVFNTESKTMYTVRKNIAAYSAKLEAGGVTAAVLTAEQMATYSNASLGDVLDLPF